MAEAVKSITASTYSVSTGLGLRYIGQFCYAYSGEHDVALSEVSLIDTVSGAGIIRGSAQFAYGEPTGEDFRYLIYFNDLIIMNQVVSGTTDTPIGPMFYKLIIPPFTKIKMTAQNLSASNAREQTALLTGRVYGAE